MSHYLSYNFADFHDDIFFCLEEDDVDRLDLLGFRESAKSALVNTVFVLWCICYGKRKFIVLASEETGLAATQTTSVAYELLFNEKIIQDFGKLYYDEDEGQVKARKRSLGDFTTRNGIRVLAASWKTKVRGLRHNEARPDLVVVDDMDSLKSVKNLRIRDDKWTWFKAEVLSGINQAYGKVIALGNMIHYDCFMARAQKEPGWIHLSFPIFRGEFGVGEILWEDKYVWTIKEADELNKVLPKEKKKIAIEKIKIDKGSRVFGQEYLLVPATDEDRIFKLPFMEQCKDYDRSFEAERLVGTWKVVVGGNDLAISEETTSDNFVVATLGIEKTTDKLVIMDIYRDKNLTPKMQRSTLQTKHEKFDYELIFIEDNAYQAFFVKDMRESTKLPVKGFRTGTNKRDEVIGLNAMALLFENGNIVLPYKGESTQKEIDILIDEALQYPDGHSGDTLMAVWFAWQAIREMKHRPRVHTGISKKNFYRKR